MVLSSAAKLARASARRSTDKAISTKRSPKGLNKGTGAPSHGRITSKGKYIPQNWKLPSFVVPSLQGFKLTPYVDPTTPKPKRQ